MHGKRTQLPARSDRRPLACDTGQKAEPRLQRATVPVATAPLANVSPTQGTVAFDRGFMSRQSFAEKLVPCPGGQDSAWRVASRTSADGFHWNTDGVVRTPKTYDAPSSLRHTAHGHRLYALGRYADLGHPSSDCSIPLIDSTTTPPTPLSYLSRFGIAFLGIPSWVQHLQPATYLNLP